MRKLLVISHFIARINCISHFIYTGAIITFLTCLYFALHTRAAENYLSIVFLFYKMFVIERNQYYCTNLHPIIKFNTANCSAIKYNVFCHMSSYSQSIYCPQSPTTALTNEQSSVIASKCSPWEAISDWVHSSVSLHFIRVVLLFLSFNLTFELNDFFITIERVYKSIQNIKLGF